MYSFNLLNTWNGTGRKWPRPFSGEYLAPYTHIIYEADLVVLQVSGGVPWTLILRIYQPPSCWRWLSPVWQLPLVSNTFPCPCAQIKMYHSIVKHSICLHLSIWFAAETCLMVLTPRLWSLWTLSEHSRLISIEVSPFIAVGTFWGCVVRFWYHCQQNN